MTTMSVLDTSVLLAEGRRALYAFGDATVVVPLVVVRELESKRSHPELGYTARSALKELRELSRKGDIKEGVKTGNSTVRVELNHVTHDGLGLILDKVSSLNDTKIVSVAKHLTDDGHDTTLYTKDIPLALLATLVDVKADDLPFVGNKEIHKPIQTYYVTDEDIDLLYSEGSARLDIDSPINTGVILQGANASAIAITRPEFKFEVVRDAGVFGVEGRSAPQTVALSQLTDESIKAVSLGGPAGTGKTMLALAAGLHAVTDKESPIEKVVVFRNMYAVGDQELGYLPGTEAEKMDPWTAAVWDAANSIPGLAKTKVQDLKNKKTIEVLPLTHIRGRTFHNTFIIVDEAQNLTRDTIKTVLTRAGTNTRVILTHDISQRDNIRVGRFEGIYEVISRMQGNKLFAHTTLTKSERSSLAEAASSLLDD